MGNSDRLIRRSGMVISVWVLLVLGIPGLATIALIASGGYPFGLFYSIAVLIIVIAVTSQLVQANRSGLRRWVRRAWIAYGVGLCVSVPVSVWAVVVHDMTRRALQRAFVDDAFTVRPMGLALALSLVLAIVSVPVGRGLVGRLSDDPHSQSSTSSA